MEFAGFPKIARLNRDIIITEKIDGTNAAIGITPNGEVYAQSRTRIIVPSDDNFGFAKWVDANKEALQIDLGIGLHFGEWWGMGIQRGYGQPTKLFSLFNTTKWAPLENMFTTSGLRVVPTIYVGMWMDGDKFAPTATIDKLREHGSYAAPGFMKPEGIVVYHQKGGVLFKATIEKDEAHKFEQAAL